MNRDLISPRCFAAFFSTPYVLALAAPPTRSGTYARGLRPTARYGPTRVGSATYSCLDRTRLVLRRNSGPAGNQGCPCGTSGRSRGGTPTGTVQTTPLQSERYQAPARLADSCPRPRRRLNDCGREATTDVSPAFQGWAADAHSHSHSHSIHCQSASPSRGANVRRRIPFDGGVEKQGLVFTRAQP